jgi:hypothetical protein
MENGMVAANTNALTFLITADIVVIGVQVLAGSVLLWEGQLAAPSVPRKAGDVYGLNPGAIQLAFWNDPGAPPIIAVAEVISAAQRQPLARQHWPR